MFSFFKKTEPKTDGSQQPKKSLYRRFQDSKRGEISEEDVLKYTGKTKDEIREWGKNRPGVAGNQHAGKLDMGGTSGLGGLATGEGFGGWGPGANPKPKFPPTKEEGKKVESDDD